MHKNKVAKMHVKLILNIKILLTVMASLMELRMLDTMVRAVLTLPHNSEILL